MTVRAWEASVSELESGTQRMELRPAGCASLLSWGEVARGWRDRESFRTFFRSTLTDMPYRAGYLETPPVTAATIDRPFECVVIRGPELEIPADPGPFSARFREAAGAPIASFPSLGLDAWLIAPCPLGPWHACSHLLSFLREGSPEQADALFAAVGEHLLAKLGAPPVWVSTAGLGVAWVHVRLDSRPKYYRHGPYRHRGDRSSS